MSFRLRRSPLRRRYSPRFGTLARKRRKVKIYISICLAVFVCAGGAWVLTRDVFFISAIDVSGTVNVSRGAVRGIAEGVLEQYTTLLVPGRHIAVYAKSKDEIVDRIKAATPRIKDAAVSLEGLNRLSIYITERTPRIIGCGSGGGPDACYYVDEEGVAYASYRGAPSSSMRIYKNTDVARDGVFLPQERLAQFVFFRRTLARVGIHLAEVHIDEYGDYSLMTEEGVRLLVSRDLPPEESMNNLLSLIGSAHFEDQGFSVGAGFSSLDYIDLRFGRRLFYKK